MYTNRRYFGLEVVPTQVQGGAKYMLFGHMVA